MTRSRLRHRTRCICRRTSIRCSACGRIRSAPISRRKPRQMTLRRRIIRIGPIRSCPISRISLCTPTCRRRETATRSRSSIRFPTLNHFSSRSWGSTLRWRPLRRALRWSAVAGTGRPSCPFATASFPRPVDHALRSRAWRRPCRQCGGSPRRDLPSRRDRGKAHRCQ